METAVQSLEQTLADLDRIAPDVPLLALGQTVFWDEPMKAGVAGLTSRRFLGGVHDTDYFAKLPGYHGGEGAPKFVAVRHNDTRTKSLWSAAAEFSSLFGSETVITRDLFLKHGLRLEKVLAGRANLLDEATEAYGWSGVVSTEESPPVTADLSLASVYPVLYETLKAAIDETLSRICEPDRLLAAGRASQFLKLVDKVSGEASTLAEFYRRLLVDIYSFVAGSELNIEPTRTTELLQFNTATCHRPRFALVDRFLGASTAERAKEAYNEAVAGSEIYTLDRFMSGAIPFDLVIPGRGRGTIRVAKRAIVIMTPKPRFISLKRPIGSIEDLAEAVEGKFGTGCTLIGKAVTLIGMLSSEFVFVFHEGASSYVKYSRRFHQALEAEGIGVVVNPILRLRYRAWDSLAKCYTWLKLPEPLRQPFGAEEICAPSFAARWREVGDQQRELLSRLANLRRPMDLVAFLAEHAGASWACLAREYEALHARLETLEEEVGRLKDARHRLYGELSGLRQQRVAAEREKGEHWRDRIFEKDPLPADWDRRAELTAAVEHVVHRIAETRQRIRELLSEQREVARDPEVQAIHERRRAIEREAELKRMRLIRSAIIATKGLENAGLRPSAWWFPIVCSDGGWFRETISTAESYLEPLQ